MSRLSAILKALMNQPSGRVLRIVGPSVLLVIGSIVACFLLWRDGAVEAETKSGKGGDWLEVKRGDFKVVCREDGELRPVKVTTIGFLWWGKIAWMVDEGTRVKKGDKLVSLETDKLKEQIEQAQDELADAERDLAEQEQARDLEIKRLEADMQAEKDRLALARLKEKEALAHPTDFEREEASNGLKRAQARLASAKAKLDSIKPLIEKGFAQRSDVEAKQLDLKLAGIELKQAKLKASQLLGGPIPSDRRLANLEREQAEIAFKLKELDRDVAIEGAEAKVRSAQNRAKYLRKRLADRQRNFNESTRTAPHDGIVSYRTVGWHRPKKVEIGDKVGPWYHPIDLPSYDIMKVRTQVPESVVRELKARRNLDGTGQGEGRIARGSAASVWVKTLPGRVYPAEVIWIDGWGRDRNATLSDADVKSQGLSGVKVFNVEVELRESDPERLREGFRATVEFPIRTIPNVIVVPSHAVDFRHGIARVRVRDKGRPRTRAIKLGTESNGQVVVKEGLREGEKIWVPPAPTKVEETQVGGGGSVSSEGKKATSGARRGGGMGKARSKGKSSSSKRSRRKRSGSGRKHGH